MKGMQIEPKHIMVSTISMCTMRCWHCVYGSVHIPRAIMPEKFVLKLIEELARINYSNRLSFYGVNEPLLDPRVIDFIAYAREKLPASKMLLTSNGDLATITLVERFFEVGLDRFQITIHENRKIEDFMKIKEKHPRRVVLVDHSTPKNQQHFHNAGGAIKSVKVKQERHTDKGCAFPFRQIALYPDCTLGLCVEGYSDELRVKVEDSQSILDVYYNNEKLNQYREMLMSNKRDLLPCSECSHEGHYNLLE